MEEWGEAVIGVLKTAFYITIGAAVKLMHYAKKNTIDKKRVVITFTFAVFVGVIVNHVMIIKGWHEWMIRSESTSYHFTFYNGL